MAATQHINSSELTYRGETRTDFAGLIIASADDGKQFYRFLFDQHGNPATDTEQVQALCNFFEIRFTPGTLDGEPCLIQSENL